MENFGGHTFLCFRGAEGEGRRTCVGSGFLTLPQEEVSFLLSRASAFQTNVISQLEPEVLSHVTHELPGCNSPGEVSGCKDLFHEFVTWGRNHLRDPLLSWRHLPIAVCSLRWLCITDATHLPEVSPVSAPWGHIMWVCITHSVLAVISLLSSSVLRIHVFLSCSFLFSLLSVFRESFFSAITYTIASFPLLI
ncbi:hypothetical protein mRhiFer1_009343 [Rhinolophus ferrumequinum]|uniref:Uncharacterized protein n=1 Tax=Rhinolophus ferrumequinum TaxID=59479 RepID=A0A7J7RXV5_RHIFE|nr:hypothetical protein mRhiFer1_009343 [Rhinolophus ferrumequinum]